MNSSLLDRWDAVHEWLWRWRWPMRALIALSLVAGLGRWAHVRMTTPPADPVALLAMTAGSLPPPSPDDPGRPLYNILDQMMAVPAPGLGTPPPAPKGMQWRPTDKAAMPAGPGAVMSVDDGLCGPWQPNERWHLQKIITYIEDPRLNEVLKQLEAFDWNSVWMPLQAGGYASYLGYMRNVARVFCMRARCRMAQNRDVQAACRDLEVVLKLSERLEHNGPVINHIVARGCRNMVLSEVTCWSREFDLTRPEALQIIQTVRSHQREFPAHWRQMLDGERQSIDRLLDAAFSRDQNGDGWLVVYAGNSSSISDRATSALNLLTVVVNDRRTVMNKLDSALSKAKSAPDRPYTEARNRLGRELDYSQYRPFVGNPVDGPGDLGISVGLAGRSCSRMYATILPGVAFDAAAPVAVALSAYKTQHGRYPETLEQLVPALLEKVPMDPFSGQPIRYRLDDRDGYALWSVGEDAADDGGVLRNEDGTLRPSYGQRGENQTPDMLFMGMREQPALEWFLVPAGQSGDNGSDTSVNTNDNESEEPGE